MAFLVDGSNLGGRLAGQAGARDAAGVVRRILPWSRERREEVLVVFDGPPRADVADRYGPLRVVWSGGRSADDRIVELVKADPARWAVVTADRELAGRCRAEGARVVPADEFAARSSRPRRRRASSREAEGRARKPPAHPHKRDNGRRGFTDEEP
ncbi:MAG: NYN domain-containing protein, partial [Thermoanaerobaculia bacterium]